MSKEFNYSVGFYWYEDSDQIGIYTYGRDVFYGTMEEAKEFRDYCQNQPDNQGEDKRDYKIFQLVEVPEASILDKFDPYAMVKPKNPQDYINLLDVALAMSKTMGEQLDEITKNCEKNRGKDE